MATRAKTGSRTRMEPEKPMGRADPGHAADRDARSASGRVWSGSLTGSASGSGSRSPGRSRSGPSSPSSQPSLRRSRSTAYLTREGASPLGSSQASSMSWSDESTWPWWRASVASRRYSVGVRTTALPSTVTSWWAKSTCRVPSSKVVTGSSRGDLAPADGLQAGQQLDPAEGLGQVVVGAGVEAPHLVPLGPERRQHEHRHVAHVPDALEDLPTVQVGEPDVEDDDVGVALVELADPVAALDAPPTTEKPSRSSRVRRSWRMSASSSMTSTEI